jgi:hypothetical protein
MENRVILTMKAQAARKAIYFMLAILTTSFCGAWLNFGIPDDTFQCVDEASQPIEGVLVVCAYGLPNAPNYGVDFKISDQDGNVSFTNSDEIMGKLTKNGRRSIQLVYSDKTHTGFPSAGHYYTARRDPVPDSSVIRESSSHMMVFRDGNNDAARWHHSLIGLIFAYRDAQKRYYNWSGVGIENTEALLLKYATKEREAFLNAYGNKKPPINYLEKINLPRNGLREVISSKSDSLTFADITPAIP